MISIHQSQFLPWVPYFYKILRSDIFVVLDDVQYQKNGVQNRNRIKTAQGARWFTIPVSHSFGDSINSVRVADNNVYTKLLKMLELNYKKSAFFEAVHSFIRNIFNEKRSNLHQLNKELLKEILQAVGIGTPVYFSSDLKLPGRNEDLLIEIIKNFNETEYLSGKGAFNYMDLSKFENASIHVYKYEFTYAQYHQLWEKECGFLGDLSVLDLLFNNLTDAHRYISSNGSEKRVI